MKTVGPYDRAATRNGWSILQLYYIKLPSRPQGLKSTTCRLDFLFYSRETNSRDGK
jgi:hypothetical protein